MVCPQPNVSSIYHTLQSMLSYPQNHCRNLVLFLMNFSVLPPCSVNTGNVSPNLTPWIRLLKKRQMRRKCHILANLIVSRCHTFYAICPIYFVSSVLWCLWHGAAGCSPRLSAMGFKGGAICVRKQLVNNIIRWIIENVPLLVYVLVNPGCAYIMHSADTFILRLNFHKLLYNNISYHLWHWSRRKTLSARDWPTLATRTRIHPTNRNIWNELNSIKQHCGSSFTPIQEPIQRDVHIRATCFDVQHLHQTPSATDWP